MTNWMEQEVFQGFGEDRLMPHTPSALRHVEHDRIEGLREEVRRWAPKVPGVYGMVDAVGRLIYVGKSKSLRNRLMSYFMPTQEDEKGGRIAESASRIVWEVHPSEFAALLREQHLIRNFRPRFNVQGIPQRQRSVYLCLGKKPAETFYVTREVDPNAIAWEGPLVGSFRVTRVAEVLNRFFQLRDCSNQTKFRFSEQLPLFDLEFRAGCVRYEIANCLGPCAQGCSRSAYQTQVDQASEFLLGRNEQIAIELERLMRLASGRLHFEQAMRYHEDLKVVRWIVNRLKDHSKARRELTCIYPIQGLDQRPIWYFVRRGVVEHAVVAPKSQRVTKALTAEIDRWFNSDNTVGGSYVRCEEHLAIVSSWFRKYPLEKNNLRAIPSGRLFNESILEVA